MYYSWLLGVIRGLGLADAGCTRVPVAQNSRHLPIHLHCACVTYSYMSWYVEKAIHCTNTGLPFKHLALKSRLMIKFLQRLSNAVEHLPKCLEHSLDMFLFMTHVQRDESSLPDVDSLFQQAQEHAATNFVSMLA